MSDPSVQFFDVGKRYRLYSRPASRVIDALGGASLLRALGQPARDLWAVRHLCFRVQRGERLALIGRNGAGKSTTLKMLIRSLEPTEGRIQVNGRVHALMEIGTGFHPEFTGRQNIRVSLSFQGVVGRVARDIEPEIVEFSELGEFIDQPVKTYSAGMYARLAFSTATAVLPDILVIDEVLGAGDAYFAGKCLDRMRQLTEREGTTVLFVSHDASAVQMLCHRAIWIDRGMVRDDGPSLRVLKAYGAQVRADEDLRLRGRDARARKDGATLERESDSLVPVRITFRQDPASDAGSLRVALIVAASGEEALGELQVGGPMDNDRAKTTFIDELSPAGAWGPPVLAGGSHHRDVRDGGSAVMLLPRHVIEAEPAGRAIPVKLDIHAQADGPGSWNAVVAIGNGPPDNLGALAAAGGVTTMGLGAPSATPTPATPGPDSDHYGGGDCVIRRVLIADDDSPDTKVLVADRRCTIKVDVDAPHPVIDPVVVLCVYQPSGACAMQLVAHGEAHGIASIHGSTRIEFMLDPLYLGVGEYVASVAVFKRLPRLGVEPEAHHVLDRCIHFKVCEEAGPVRVERGICRQPFRVRANVR